MKRHVLAPLAAAAVLAAAIPAFAVSDGGYDYKKNGCTANAENSNKPNRAEKGCYSIVVAVSDGTHRYVTVGVPQTKDGTNGNAVEICLDFTGTPTCAHVDKSGYRSFKGRSTGKPNPRSAALHTYFGMDDNVDAGEHDSSHYVDNGPSDGGSALLNVSASSLAGWLKQAQRMNKGYLLTHPLPGVDTGVGFCADGLCISAQTQRRVAYRGSGKNKKSRDVANYAGHTWDPAGCAGPSDKAGPKQCGKHNLQWWDRQNGKTYVEPGIQVYEDPDPQASPIGAYPIPSFYVGSCGLIVGGGNVAMPKSPFTNRAGQVVVATGCPK